eukprot:CAMPEP_0203791698 /NCGR_PEP_ID=MMETSP0100_2-20121128/4789_1 /ASSEMBLY_ACC=CAM_ASM_000210 /TAXON_ID=96639 /ORGANISM=" , Strain NY0313808BC1" /LENGTH=274 /DNA_ID=CAMNT_0050695065 /DNA_START=637 /DNA_END=1461 /DNA_ORIENTATION=-
MHTLSLKKLRLPENLLFYYVSFCMFIAIVVLLCWTFVQPPVLDPCSNYQCYSNESATFIVALVIQAIEMLVLLVIAWKDRNIGAVGGETKGIFHTSICLAILLAILFISALYGTQTNAAANTSTNIANTLEAFIAYLVCFVVTVISISSIIFRKYAYVDYPQEEILHLFLSKKGTTTRSGYKYDHTARNGSTYTNQSRPSSSSGGVFTEAYEISSKHSSPCDRDGVSSVTSKALSSGSSGSDQERRKLPAETETSIEIELKKTPETATGQIGIV